MSSNVKAIPFDGIFPLPFRVFFLVGLGILGWATNLHVLDSFGVDVITALQMRKSDLISLSPRHPRSSLKASTIYSPVYRFFLAYSVWCFGAWALFIYVVHGNVLLVDAFRHIPAICALFILIALISQLDIFQKRERDVFLLATRRCFFSAFDEPVYFSDVLFADILTSFAKVLGDIWLSLCMLLPGGSLLFFPPQEGWSRWVLPTIMSLPYLARFRQCLIEYSLSTEASRRPLYNAIKYATSFPVIYLSAAQRVVVSELAEQNGGEESWKSDRVLFLLWLLTAALNSFYSFWWDVTNDWGLDLLTIREQKGKTLFSPRRLVLPSHHSESPQAASSLRHSRSFSRRSSFDETAHSITHPSALRRSHPYGLRPILLYPLLVYPSLIFFNLILRMTWSIKLSSHLYVDAYGSTAIFCLEMAELIRRWMWVFIRVEWEVVRKLQVGESPSPKDGRKDSEEFELVDAAQEERKRDAAEMDLIDEETLMIP